MRKVIAWLQFLRCIFQQIDRVDRRVWFGLIVGLAAITFMAYVFIPTHLIVHEPLFAPDSDSYINFDPVRPFGYPVFLQIVKVVLGHYEAVVFVQLALYFLFVVFLCLAFAARFGSLIATLCLELLLVINPGPIGLAFVAVSDSLSTSLGMGYLGMVLLFSMYRNWPHLLSLVTMVTVLALVRPINLILFLPASICILYLARDLKAGPKLWPAVFAIFVGGLVSIEATPIALYFVRGSMETSSPLVRGMFEKTLFNPDISSATWHCPDEAYIRELLVPVNDYIDHAPAEFQPTLEQRYSSYLRFQVIIPALMRAHRFSDEKQTNAILLCYVTNYLKKFPVRYASQVIKEYGHLISNYTFFTSDKRQRYLEFIEDHPPVLPPPTDEPPGVSAEDPLSSFKVMRSYPLLLSLAMSAFYIFSFLIFVVAALYSFISLLRRRTLRDNWFLLTVFALGVQSKLWATVAIEIALPRYIFPDWPGICVVNVLGVMTLVGTITMNRPAASPHRGQSGE